MIWTYFFWILKDQSNNFLKVRNRSLGSFIVFQQIPKSILTLCFRYKSITDVSIPQLLFNTSSLINFLTDI